MHDQIVDTCSPLILCCTPQVNYLGHWLLTHQLLAGQQRLRTTPQKHRHRTSDLVLQPFAAIASIQRTARHQRPHQSLLNLDTVQHAASDGTRVVLLSSMTHRAGRIQFDDLHAKKSYNAFRRYADSKLALLLAVRAFAQRMQR